MAPLDPRIRGMSAKMRRILLAMAVTLAAMASVQPASAGMWLNGVFLNGANALNTNPLEGSVDHITSIVLPSGEFIHN